MINGKDLRIGNWVYSNGFRGKVQVTLLADKDYEDCEPIPLSPEVLMALGFVISPAATSIYKSIPELKAEIHFENFRGGLVCVLYCSTGSFIPNDIKYVHQAQNLYFALTGTELTYNPNQP